MLCIARPCKKKKFERYLDVWELLSAYPEQERTLKNVQNNA